MNNKIAVKLYQALLRGGTPREISSSLAKSFEVFGSSDETTAERDNYEIMIISKAMSSLISRHADKLASVKDEFESADDECVETDVETAVVKFSEPDYEPVNDSDNKHKGRFWSFIESKPSWVRSVIINSIQFFMYLGMILLTCTVLCLTVACLLTMIGMTAAGIALFIIGLLYGVSQISVFPAAAYFEIGLGLILGGASALLIVILFNVLTRLLPFLLKIGVNKLTYLTANIRSFKRKLKSK